MKKESVIAILFGILLGAVVAFIIIAKNKQAQQEKAKTLTPQITTTPAPIDFSNSQRLEITSPHDKAIVDKNTVTITGKVVKNSLIIIQSPIKEIAFNNEKEEFSKDFPLSLGENVIKISAYPKDTKLRSQERDLKVYFIDEQ